MLPWIVFFAIATVTSLVTLYMRVSMFRDQVYQRRVMLSFDGEVERGAAVERARKLRNLQQKLAKTQRHEKLIYASILTGFAECVPLGILQMFFIIRTQDPHGIMGMLSLVTTWMMLGSKTVKISELPKTWSTMRKQKTRVSLLESLQRQAEGSPDRTGVQRRAALLETESLEMCAMGSSDGNSDSNDSTGGQILKGAGTSKTGHGVHRAVA